MINYINTGYKTKSEKKLLMSFIGEVFIGFCIKLTKQEQRKIFLQHRKAVNVSEYSNVTYEEVFKNGKIYLLNDIRESLINNYKSYTDED